MRGGVNSEISLELATVSKNLWKLPLGIPCGKLPGISYGIFGGDCENWLKSNEHNCSAGTKQVAHIQSGAKGKTIAVKTICVLINTNYSLACSSRISSFQSRDTE